MKMRKILSLLVSAALLTPAVPVMADGASAAAAAVRVEFEDQVISSYGTIVNKEITGISGKVVKFDTGLSGTQYLNTKVTVPEDGFYTLKMVATSAKTADGWMSPILISVNGGVQGWINGKGDGKYHVTEEDVSYDKSALSDGVWTLHKQTFDRAIPLKKGENTINFQINQREQGSGLFGFFDYYEVEKAGSFPTLNESGATIQFEDFEYRAGEIITVNSNKYAKYELAPKGTILNTYVNVTKEGRYKLGIAACDSVSDSTYASPISVVTDCYEVALDTASTEIDSTFASYGTFAGTLKMQNIIGSGVYLKEGVNKISVKILDRRSYDTNCHAAFDCIKLTYADSGAETMTAQGGRLEFENWLTPI